MARSFDRTTLFTSLCLTMTLAACAGAPAAPGRAESPKIDEARALLPLEGEGAARPRHADVRRVGDYAEHRFSGSYSQQPFSLIEEVVEREGELLVVDYRLIGTDQKRHLRVRFDDTDHIVRVSQVVGDKELEASLSDYEALLARTTFAPEYNDGLIAQKTETCLVGAKELSCEVKKFGVAVGDKDATLIVSHSEKLGRDVGGEVVAVDGTVLYRAELVEMKRGAEAPRNAQAHLDTTLDSDLFETR